MITLQDLKFIVSTIIRNPSSKSIKVAPSAELDKEIRSMKNRLQEMWHITKLHWAEVLDVMFSTVSWIDRLP